MNLLSLKRYSVLRHPLLLLPLLTLLLLLLLLLFLVVEEEEEVDDAVLLLSVGSVDGESDIDMPRRQSVAMTATSAGDVCSDFATTTAGSAF